MGLSILFESSASELSRMNAMKAATDNAEEVAKQLTSVFNKKRQAAITQEISEISAGALALEDASRPEGPALSIVDNDESVAADFEKELEDGDLPDMPVGPWDFIDLQTEV